MQWEILRLSKQVFCNPDIITSIIPLTNFPATGFIGIDTVTGYFYYNNGGIWAPLVQPFEQYIIFSPSTGNTITLIAGKRNIINSSAISSLVLALPQNPVDAQVQDIKFTNTISSLTYTGGTVIGNTVGLGGTILTLTYSLSTNTWY